MKKILFVLCFALCVLYAGAEAKKPATANEEEMLRLTHELMADCSEGQLPNGLTLNEDSTLSINLKVFLADPQAKRYFEQIGKLMMADQAAANNNEIEIGDIQIKDIPQENTDSTVALPANLRRDVSLPMFTYYLAVPYTYMSVDGKNNPVRLSSILYRPSPFQWNWTADRGLLSHFVFDLGIATVVLEAFKGLWNWAFGYTFDYGVLDCHPTVTTSKQAPTGSDPLDGPISMFCSDYAIVVCPDYCGYGLSEYRQHPYLVQGITARNVVDGYIAALDLIRDNKATGASGSWSLASDFHTDIIGYSQGGSVALATLRYLESGQVSDEQLKRINLRYTYCGDGPYSPIATVNQYVEWSNRDEDKYKYMAYPCVLPLIVQAAKEAYNGDCMHTVEVRSYFTTKFLDTGILDKLDSKRVSTDQINEVTTAAGTRTIDEIMSDRMIVKKTDPETGKQINALNTESNEYKCLMRALDYNDLTKGWEPRHPLLFLHLDGDLVVPYCNMEEVQRNLAPKAHAKMVFTTPEKVKGMLSPVWSFAQWYKDCMANPDHGSIGQFFFIAAASGAFEKLLKAN